MSGLPSSFSSSSLSHDALDANTEGAVCRREVAAARRRLLWVDRTSNFCTVARCPVTADAAPCVESAALSLLPHRKDERFTCPSSRRPRVTAGGLMREGDSDGGFDSRRARLVCVGLM